VHSAYLAALTEVEVCSISNQREHPGSNTAHVANEIRKSTGSRQTLVAAVMEPTLRSQDGNVRRANLLASIVILAVVAPVVATILFTLITLFPVIILGQREDVMILWAWVTLPLALLVTPVVTATVSFVLLRRFTSHALLYVVGAAAVYAVALTSTPLSKAFYMGGHWVAKVLT
jgi:uncharacterized membrane protein